MLPAARDGFPHLSSKLNRSLPPRLAPRHHRCTARPVVEPVDAETRYALGMAYKDMGSAKEAKEEFILSMKDLGSLWIPA